MTHRATSEIYERASAAGRSLERYLSDRKWRRMGDAAAARAWVLADLARLEAAAER